MDLIKKVARTVADSATAYMDNRSETQYEPGQDERSVPQYEGSSMPAGSAQEYYAASAAASSGEYPPPTTWYGAPPPYGVDEKKASHEVAGNPPPAHLS